ncbi:hypothetical protein AC369_07270 [Salmonella enterica subsp. diarizonae]|nr:hypothetical protein [Salmonella enterica subsp. diarizonae]
MGSNIIELVKLGHERAAELKGSYEAINACSVAQLISDLATQLDVQLARSNALAAENAGLKSKAAELVHEASEVYSAYNSTITEPDGDFMDMQTLQEMQCVETPATDDFLAEVRAQGVERYAAQLKSEAELADEAGWDGAAKFLISESGKVLAFAAQIRQEAAK